MQDSARTAAKPRVLQISIGIISGIGRVAGFPLRRGVHDIDGLDFGCTQSASANQRGKLKLQQATAFGGMSMSDLHAATLSQERGSTLHISAKVRMRARFAIDALLFPPHPSWVIVGAKLHTFMIMYRINFVIGLIQYHPFRMIFAYFYTFHYYCWFI